MRNNYRIVLILAVASSPASFCGEQTAQGWVAPPDFVKKFEDRDKDTGVKSNFREEL